MATQPVALHAQQPDSTRVDSARVRMQQLDSLRLDSLRTARADSARGRTLQSVRVTGRADDLTGIAQAASQGRVGRADLRTRPMLREGELLENVPGMILTQHSGDGKANQMFVRGLNLDHGTDFQTRIESMPLNLPTHAHGQGYSDLNLIIPELVDELEYKLGPYYAELGDFGSAGGATLQLARLLPAPIAQVEAGAWGFGRTVLAGSRTLGSSTFLLGGEAKRYDGPWITPQGLRKLSGMARWTWRSGANEVSLLGLSYGNRWNASDQIPARAVQTGALSPFGQVDPTLGGTTDRSSLSLAWRRLTSRGVLNVDAYAVRYGFGLYSNFTYFLEDANSGDQIEQRDDRRIAGLDVSYASGGRAFGVPHTVRVGVQGRFDDATVALYQTTARTRNNTVRADDVQQGSAALWTAVESRWTPYLRSTIGVRGDAFQFDVDSDRPANSGRRTAGIASPKLSIVLSPFQHTEFYLGGGLGFHSNDARGTTITTDPQSGERVPSVDPLVRSRGAEVGVRTATDRNARVSASLWTLALESELLFVGDAGTTEPQGRSRRHGVTVASFWRPMRALTFDGDVSFTRARYLDEPVGEQAVPGALENVVAAGVTWEPMRDGPVAALRVRHLGAHPLVETNAVRGTATTLVNATLGWSLRGARVTAGLYNLLGSAARDVQYFYASRLAGEPAGGVEDLHYHPAEPRQLRLALSFGR